MHEARVPVSVQAGMGSCFDFRTHVRPELLQAAYKHRTRDVVSGSDGQQDPTNCRYNNYLA